MLEPEAVDSFLQAYEGWLATPRSERRVVISRSIGGRSGTSVRSGTFRGRLPQVDLDTMIGVGLLVRTGRDVYMFNPAAGRYYEHVMTRRGRGFEAVEETVRRHLDAQRFSQRYPKTHRLLRQASAAVFSDDAHGKSTQVGHHIREALMEFTDELATRLGVALDAPANKTNDRLRTIIRSQRDSLGSRTIENYLDAMVGYWIGASHLAQRQEHGAQAERETLGWEDARRVVFGAMMLVYELDRALCRE